MTPELQQIIGILIGVLAVASLVRMELFIRHAHAEAQRKLAALERAVAEFERLQAEQAAGAKGGAGTVSGAPPQQE